MSICPKCKEGYILPGEPTGSINTDFQGAYFAPSPNKDVESKRAIVFLTDGFGLPLKNCKIMADNLATKLECDVWVPDYFNGKPLIPLDTMMIERAGEKWSIWQWIKFVVGTGIPNFPAFISNRPSVADKRLDSFFALLKEKKSYEKLGAVGYCFGGTTATRLGGTDHVQSVVICHPGPPSISDIKKIKVPAAWACAEEDQFWGRSARLQAEAAFAARKDTDNFVEYEFKDYKGTAHGFAARPNLDLPEIKEAFELAFEQTVQWFQKTLTV